jgi:iron complex outermembrane receptor protein
MTDSVLRNRRFRAASGASRRVLVLALLGTSVPALAQAVDDTGEEIVVTGFRAALAGSIETKRLSDLIVETVKAEDIAKLPDQSIADAISRLPGLTTQRLDGRAQVISIRGLGPDFSTTLFNGREQVTTNDNRGVEFDQYPAEVINQVNVYKTPEATLIGAGLAGTVDLRSIRPLDYGKDVIGVSARGEWVDTGKINPDAKTMGYRVTGTLVQRFAEDRIGIALSVAHLSSPTQNQDFRAWGYPTTGDGNFIIGGSQIFATSTDLTRTAVVGTLQYEPTENFSTSLDIYYSKFKDEQVKRGVEFPLFWSGAQLQPGATIEDGAVTAGQFNGVETVVNNHFFGKDADLFSIGWNVRAGNDVMRAMFDASYSTTTRKEQILETNAGTGRGPLGVTDNVGFELTGAGATFRPSLDYSNFNLIQLTSPNGWGGDIVPGGQAGYLNNRTIDDDILQFRAEMERDFDNSFFKSVQVGMNITMRDKSLTPDEFFLSINNGVGSVPVPEAYRLGTADLGFVGVGGVIAYDMRGLVNDGVYAQIRNPNADVSTKGWSVSEDVFTGFIKFNIENESRFGRLTGNAGVQLVQTDQSSNGIASSGTGAGVVNTPIRDGDSYFYALPTMNLALRMDNDMIVRFAVGRQLARPRLDDMRASINYSYNEALAGSTDINQSPWGGGGGNPRLRPWIADSVDLGVEKYFGSVAYVAIGGFYKNLKTFIFQQNQLFDFTGFPVTGGPEPVLRQGFVNVWANGEGGNLYGFEVSGAVPFGNSGFGMNGGYSFTETNITPNPGNPAEPIPGFSKHVASGTVYYEKGGFSARSSVRYRSTFLGDLTGFGGSRERRLAQPEVLLDAQIGYEFQSGPLEGLSLVLQGYNLTNEPFTTTDLADDRLIIDNEQFGRRFLFGASYRF